MGTARTWDVENRLSSITVGGVTTDFIYDGDGNRVKKIVRGTPDVTTIYVNQYYEKNITNSIVTAYYYLGSKLIAQYQGNTLNYIQQDSLGSTSVISDTTGASTGTIRYLPFGDCRFSTGTMPTDKLFTGQRLDSTGLYYYGARYYDPQIGRFISPDSIVSDPLNPQSLNRYSYVLNNPLRYNDPSGTTVNIADGGLQSWIDFCQTNPEAALAMGQSDDMFNWGTANPDDGLAMAYFLARWVEPSLPKGIPLFWMPQGGAGVTLWGATPLALTGIPPLDLLQEG